MLSWHIPRARPISVVMEQQGQTDLLKRRKKAKKALSLAKREPLNSWLIIQDRAAETVSAAPTSSGLTSGGTGRHVGTGNEGRKPELNHVIKGIKERYKANLARP